MPEASFPASWLKKNGLRVGLVSVTLALLAGFAVNPVSFASPADIARADAEARAAKVRADEAAGRVSAAEAAAGSAASTVNSASKTVDGSKAVVSSADEALNKVQKELETAQAKLFDVQQQLQAAHDKDAKLGEDLADAQKKLEAAKTQVATGSANVEKQRKAMAENAREEFQKKNSLENAALILGAQTASELSQRVQWSEMVFDTQSAAKAQLDVELLNLDQARVQQFDMEARIARDKAAAEAQVKIVADLEKSAKSQEGQVQVLVDKQSKALDAAQAQLSSDQGKLDSAQAASSASQQALADAKAQLEQARAEYRQELADAQALRDGANAAIASERASGGAVKASSSGFIRPLDANPGSPFGMRFHPILKYWRMHSGTDFGAPCGMPIRAAKEGKVMTAAWTGGYGNYILIGHGTMGGAYVTTGYAHMSRYAVSAGQWVSQGQVIGYVGTTGLSTGCHLHLEVRRNGNAVNPMNYIP